MSGNQARDFLPQRFVSAASLIEKDLTIRRLSFELNQFNGSFVEAEMVKSFISSIEYRRRFE